MDALREDLVTNYPAVLDTIRFRMKYAPSREGAATKVSHSMQLTNCDEPTDTPIYKICRWIETHDLTGMKDNKELRKRIVLDTGVRMTTLISILKKNMFDLPSKLLYVGRFKEAKAMVVPKTISVRTPVAEMAEESPANEPVRLTKKPEQEVVNIPTGLKEVILKTNNLELILRF